MPNPRVCRLAALISSALVCSGAAFGQQVTQTVGPDIIVCNFTDVSNSGTTTVNGVVYDQFAVGTTSANRGNQQINWYTGTGENRHPAISEGVYRYIPSLGHFEQLAVGSVKHGFEALQDNDCASPNYFNFGCTSSNNGGVTLGVGCADPYCCGLNFAPGDMAPRYEINASTGLFPYPNSTTYVGSSGPSRVRLADLQGAPAGTRYFEEAQYIVGDDAGAHNNNNNASWQEVSMSPAAPAPSATDFTTALTGSIHREQPAIYAWQALDTNVMTTTFDVPNDGRFILACKVSGPVGGLYTYEYALHNLNSNRCAGSFVVPLPGTQSALSNVGFHDVEYVGEPNATPTNAAANDWTVTGASPASAQVSWIGPAYSGTPATYVISPTTPYKVASFTPGTGNDHSANVLRWGTMFNFRFQSEVAPASTGSIAVGLWRPGTGAAFVMNNVPTPAGATVSSLSAACCNGLACTVTTQSDCGAGSWDLPGTTCTPNNPCLNGACCLPNLTCFQFDASDCTEQGGAYQGDGSACSANPCPTGACCSNTTGICTIGGSSCPAGSTYMGLHTSCTATVCPMGACCNNSTAACAVGGTGCPSGSTFMGAGSVCGSVTCIVTAYCTAGAGTCGTANNDERISEVIFHTIDNLSGTGNGPAGCYRDYTSLSTTLTPGQSYPVTLRNAAAYDGDQSAVWIDWNHNLGFFESNEQFTLTSTDGGSTFTGTVTVPPTALSGATRMRARVTYTDGLSPCGDSVYGDVQDYTVVVSQPGVCCRGATCNTTVTTAAACTASLIPGQTAGAAFASGSSCNVVGITATPCCYADYNKTNGINVQDIFDFLNDWFAGSPYSNTAGNGTTQPLSVTNIFSYLNAWFSGC